MSEAQAAPALGPEDYSALLGMLTSDDASTRTQGQTLAKKLTPSEQQTFFDVQQQANKGKGELTRGDNQVALGVAPEFAATGVIPVARAVAGAGASLASKATAAATAIGPQVAAQAKYWATKSALTKLGVPDMLAEGAAVAVSGYRKGAKEAPASAEPEAAPAPAAVPSASPVASAPVAATVPASPVPSTAAPPPTAAAPPSVPSPQQVLNEQALAARRAAYQARQAAVPDVPAAVAKPKLLASEAPEYMRLLKAGKTHQQAMDVIEANRVLQERLGLSTPTAADTRFPKGFRGKVDPE